MDLIELNKAVVVVFAVSNLAAMGLELNPGQAVKALKNPVYVSLIFVWGWVVGPALAYLLTLIIPLSAPHAAGLLLMSLAPMTPAYPVMVSKARGDMSAAGAFTVVATVGTVLLLPLLAPWLISGLGVSVWALAQPLLTLILLPLVIGVAIRVYAAQIADKLLPGAKKLGGLSTLLCAGLTIWIYWTEMLATVGSFAIGALLLFLIVLTVLCYRIGFGLDQGHRSAMSLGMCTRNISALFVAYLGISNPDPGVFVIIVLLIPLTLIVGFGAARLFAGRAGGAATLASA